MILPSESYNRKWKEQFEKIATLYPPSVKVAYQVLKEQLIQQQWESGNDYNERKDEFIQREGQNALRWYKEIKK